MASSRSSSRSGGGSPAAADEEGATGGQQQPELRRGPWTVDEDLALVNYVTDHGEGRWNSLAQAAGLKRTGKSCRLRWLNYLRPDVKRGNFTADEQLLILDLHSRYGNRWSKIAQHLPGRTDNEIKNYWRTRVQKHAKQLNCDANSRRFKDAMRYLWMPHLVDADVHHHAADAYTTAIDVHAQLSGMGAVTSSSSDSFATTTTTTSESHDAAGVPMMNKLWDQPTAAAAYGVEGGEGVYYDADDVRAGEMLVANAAAAGGDWVQETNQAGAAAAAGMMWCDHKAQANYIGAGQIVEDPELSGWVQSFAEGAVTENFWTLEDIWKMQS